MADDGRLGGTVWKSVPSTELEGGKKPRGAVAGDPELRRAEWVRGSQEPVLDSCSERHRWTAGEADGGAVAGVRDLAVRKVQDGGARPSGEGGHKTVSPKFLLPIEEHFSCPRAGRDLGDQVLSLY